MVATDDVACWTAEQSEAYADDMRRRFEATAAERSWPDPSLSETLTNDYD